MRRRSPRRTRALAILAAIGTLAVAGGAFAGVSSAAGGTTGGNGEPGGGISEPGGSTGANCPSSNPPNEMTLLAGTPQTALLNGAFATTLQVQLANSDGCQVTTGAAGVPVTFTAPSGGASGVFSTSDVNTATVGADSGGAAQAPAFTADGIAGSYTVTASSQYGSVTFALTNTAAGTPARLLAVSPARQSATVAGRYRRALAVRVLDAAGDPVAGVSVAFTLTASTATTTCGSDSSAAGGSGSGADATFAGGAAEATATSNAAGVATAPALTANGETGTFTASAALDSSGSGEPRGNAASTSSASGNVAPALFTLTNRAGAPAKLTPGVGATQSAPVGAPFPVSLAVTVTDAHGNRVPDTLVSFTAPVDGPSGRFATRAPDPRRGAKRGHGASVGRAHRAFVAGRQARAASHRARAAGHQAHLASHQAHPAGHEQRVASVRTNACGVAVAPALTADGQPGGYVVRATAGHARPAAFALVNEAR